MNEDYKNSAALKFAVRSATACVIAVIVLTFLTVQGQAQPSSVCDRACMAGIVDQILASMVAHNPDTLPLATVYSATENSHPSALGFMTLWRTVTKADGPSLLAIDTKARQAYFALAAGESGSQSVVWGRVKVVERKITELELFVNRSKGDHGFSFSAEQLATNYKKVMSPPATRKKATREELEKISRAAFDASIPLKLDVAPDCQFTEAGSRVIDPGLDDGTPSPAVDVGGGGPTKDSPLGCIFPPFRPSDPKAREVVIDEELGIVVDGGVVPGTVYPYPFYGHMVSAFIPRDMPEPSKVQEKWFQKKVDEKKTGLLSPMPATGETMYLNQYYDGKLQASQINVYLSGPGMKSVWVK